MANWERGNQAAWISMIQPDLYLREFPQEIPVLEDRWSFDIRPGGRCIVVLPNKVSVHLSGDPDDLGLEEPAEFQTSMLWKHSLAILPSMLQSGHEETVSTILEGYAEFMQGERWQDLSKRMTSLDHCVATRIRTMCALRAISTVRGISFPSGAREVLREDLRWAGDPYNYAPNNHGLMLAVATMHANEIFPDETPEQVVSVGSMQFESIIAAAFDDQWVCVENTPEYQGFYLTLCSNVLKFLEYSSRSDAGLKSRLQELVDRATMALGKMLLPSGHYPALGDSGTPWRPPIEGVDGVTFSSRTGLFIQKNSGVFFSFKCGYASYVHKHMDDTSITLHVDGEDLILDGGLHNYDWHDPITRAVKSQRGHSGFFFPEFDHLYPSTMYRPEKYRVQSNLRSLGLDSRRALLSGRSVIDGTHAVMRLLEYTAGRIEIVDRHWMLAGSGPAEPPVQRFLLPESLTEREVRPGVLRFEGQAAWIAFEFDPTREVVTHVGSADELPRGWVSRGWSKAVPCRSIDILVSDSSAAARLTVRFGRQGACSAAIDDD